MGVTLKEADYDLHSGMVGGVAYNPNRALAELLCTFHDKNGKVTIPGFYDEILPISIQERKELSFDFNENRFKTLFGFKPTRIEQGTTPQEAIWLRPTLEINGMWGGYTGPGFKTVIPARAHAKISCRLVPNQKPEKIVALVKEHILKNSPAGMQTDVEIYQGSGKAFRTNPHSPLVKLMAQSYADVFQKPCQKILMGGSIPVAVDLCETAEAEMVLIGLGFPDDRIHSPNERFGIGRLEKGFLTICHAIELFAQIPL